MILIKASTPLQKKKKNTCRFTSENKCSNRVPVTNQQWHKIHKIYFAYIKEDALVLLNGGDFLLFFLLFHNILNQKSSSSYGQMSKLGPQIGRIQTYEGCTKGGRRLHTPDQQLQHRQASRNMTLFMLLFTCSCQIANFVRLLLTTTSKE